MMSTNERPSRRGFLLYAILTLSMTLAMVSASCSGSHTTVGLSGSVKVDPQNCKESRGVLDAGADADAAKKNDAPVLQTSGDLAVLDCLSGSVGGTVQISFPRKEWNSILASGVGSVDAGPGK
jgi:hypothetical protein